MRNAWAIAATALLAGCAVPRPPAAAPAAPPATVAAPAVPLVAGGIMTTDRTIAQNIAAAPALSQLRVALQAAGLTTIMESSGLVTLFAPTDEAFARMAPGTLAALLRPENRASLVPLLRFWIVPGRVTTDMLRERLRAGGGRALLATSGGEALAVTLTNDVVTLTDGFGHRAYVAQPDNDQANGMLQVINGLLVPAALGHQRPLPALRPPN